MDALRELKYAYPNLLTDLTNNTAIPAHLITESVF